MQSVTFEPADIFLNVQIVGVVDNDAVHLQPRQFPIEADEDASMVVQLGSPNMYEDQYKRAVELEQQNDPEYNLFLEKFRLLEPQVLASCLVREQSDLFNLLGDIPCVGCRRAAETFYTCMASTGYPTLEPITLLHPLSRTFTLKKEYLQCPKKLYSILYLQKRFFDSVVDNIPRQRKNKRCNLHCLESHKVKSLSMWMDVWSIITNEECREEMVLVGFDAFLDTLDAYLHKHRFCGECKSKVQRAYDIMVGLDSPRREDTDFQPHMFEQIRVCSAERHIHLPCSDIQQLSAIINRAETELATLAPGQSQMDGNRRERHAKTLDVAQEEVLTCLGIHLYDKLHKLGQKVRAEEQTWLLLVQSCFESLKRGFETAIEKTRGFSNLELFCQEYDAENKAAAAKKEQKREKKRAKRNKGKNAVVLASGASAAVEVSCADCGSQDKAASRNRGGCRGGKSVPLNGRQRHSAGHGALPIEASTLGRDDGGYHSHSSSGRGDSADPSDCGGSGSPGSECGHRRAGSGGSSTGRHSPPTAAAPAPTPTESSTGTGAPPPSPPEKAKYSPIASSLCSMLDDQPCFAEEFEGDEEGLALPDSVLDDFHQRKTEIDRKRQELRNNLRLKFEAMASNSRE